MKITLKKIFLSAALISLSVPLFSFDFGGLLSNTTKFSGKEVSDLTLDQKNSISLWLKTPVSEDGLSYFVTEGSFSTEYDDSIPASDDKLLLTGDLSLFKLVIHQELSSGDLTISTGRFYNEDLTGIIYSQNGDGLKAEFQGARFNVSAFGVYTGLLNAKNTTILTDASPANTSPELSDKPKKLYVLADKYAVAGLVFDLPNLIAAHGLSLEGLASVSLDSETADYNRFYGTVLLSGPIVSSVFYDLSSTLGFSKYDDGDMEKSNLSKIAVTAYPSFKSMSVSLNGVYASGKQGSFEFFKGFTSNSAVNSLAEPEYSALAKAGLSATIKPVSNVLAALSADMVFDAAKEIEYQGFQYSANANWQIVSDVSAGLSFGQYFDNDDSGNNKTQLKINASIAF
ncbi:hypothetical protein [Treponema sp.]|uniref:hypothetical protein n=1 Tax=Treponema sp. TaxID=166 RepID=UPI00388E27A1